MDPASQRFEDDLTALIQRHGQALTDNQVITVLERAIDEAYVIAGDEAPWRALAGLKDRIEQLARLDDEDGRCKNPEDRQFYLARANGLRMAAGFLR